MALNLGLGLPPAPKKGVGAYRAWASAKAKMVANASDVTFNVFGDSLGDDTTDCIYKIAQGLATRYPTHSVKFYWWTDGSNVYSAPTTIQTGSGAQTLHVYNACVGGASSWYLMGAKKAAAIDAINSDLDIWLYGKNQTSAVNPRGETLNGWEMDRLAHPTAAQVVILEPPNRDDNAMDGIVAAQRALADLYGDVTLVDTFAIFNALGKPASLYADNFHPNAAGSQVMADVALSQWDAAGLRGFTPAGAFMAQTGTNGITNGDFSNWTGALPVSWTSAGGSPTTTKDAADPYPGAAYSCEITGTTAGASIRDLLSAGQRAAVAGQSGWIAARMKVDVGQPSAVGQIAGVWQGPSAGDVTARANTIARGGWVWQFVYMPLVPTDITNAYPQLFNDSAANVSSYVNIDRVVWAIGDRPYFAS